jgi:hypothetical protein
MCPRAPCFNKKQKKEILHLCRYGTHTHTHITNIHIAADTQTQAHAI